MTEGHIKAHVRRQMSEHVLEQMAGSMAEEVSQHMPDFMREHMSDVRATRYVRVHVRLDDPSDGGTNVRILARKHVSPHSRTLLSLYARQGITNLMPLRQSMSHVSGSMSQDSLSTSICVPAFFQVFFQSGDHSKPRSFLGP